MNYSELKDDDNEYLLNLYNLEEIENENYIDGNKILMTYNKLNEQMNKYKMNRDKLKEQKEIFYKYQNNILNSHLDIINIINENENNDVNKLNNSTEIFINYENIIKDIYKTWIEDFYNPSINKIDKDIDNIEIKISNFRKLFINIINNIIPKTETIIKKMCPICFENEVDMCAIPCGHTCCNTCIISSATNYYNNNRCLNCRIHIDKYMKIYFMI